jgi:hypothetical protein
LVDLIEVEIAAEIEHGKPFVVSGALVRIPPEAIDEHELVYRVRRAPDMRKGDLLIVEPRNTAFTGELVVAFRGPNAFIGHWWAKHGLRELRLEPDNQTVDGELQIAGAVTLIVRMK